MHRGGPSDVMNPTVVGALTALVALIAVFISYNANNGLPFVPTYDIAIEVPDGQELSPNSQVRIGGYRVGFVKVLEAVREPDGTVKARASVKLDTTVQPLRDDSRTRVRPQSLLGLKYIEVLPGRNGKPVPPGGTIGTERSLPNVDIEEVFGAFDPRTRKNLERLITGFGSGLAGRGQDLNEFAAAAPGLFRDLNPVLADLADPATRTGDSIRAFSRLAADLAPVAPALSKILADGATTFRALEDAGPELERILQLSPGTVQTASSALDVLGPVLHDARRLTDKFAPAAALLPESGRQARSILRTATPILRRFPRLGTDLEKALTELRRLSAEHPTVPTLRALADGLPLVSSVVEYLAPLQLNCNYTGMTLRNVASAGSEGNAAGTWLRFMPVFPLDEAFQRSTPAPDLHFNPYPNFGAPGQENECEGGREGYVPGQTIGNVPGNQGTGRPDTSGEEGL